MPDEYHILIIILTEYFSTPFFSQIQPLCNVHHYKAVLYQRHSLFFYFLSCLVDCLLHEDLSSKRHLDMHTNLPTRIEPWPQYSTLVAQ